MKKGIRFCGNLTQATYGEKRINGGRDVMEPF